MSKNQNPVYAAVALFAPAEPRPQPENPPLPLPNPFSRHFGPVSYARALHTAELALDDARLHETLAQFANGRIEPAAMAYEIQIILEGVEERIRKGESS